MKRQKKISGHRVTEMSDEKHSFKRAIKWIGGVVSSFQFDASQNVPHNSVDPAADAAIRALIYDKIFEIIETKE